MTSPSIAGYTYGATAPSPLTMQDLDLLQQSVLWSAEDEQYLRQAGEILGEQVEQILDLWYGFVGSHPHLVRYFSTTDGHPLPDYLARVRTRFGQWIRDTCTRPYDQTWLDYQYEIALRHHSTKKNKTDHADAVPIIPLRYMIAFIFPITATIRGFLANKGHAPDEVDKMYHAWFKSVVLQVTLWSYPYVREGEF